MKRRTNKEMNIAIQNYRMVVKDWFKREYSYKQVKKLIEDHIDGKRYDSTYYVLENILYYKLNNVNYALGY